MVRCVWKVFICSLKKTGQKVGSVSGLGEKWDNIKKKHNKRAKNMFFFSFFLFEPFYLQEVIVFDQYTILYWIKFTLLPIIREKNRDDYMKTDENI